MSYLLTLELVFQVEAFEERNVNLKVIVEEREEWKQWKESKESKESKQWKESKGGKGKKDKKRLIKLNTKT